MGVPPWRRYTRSAPSTCSCCAFSCFEFVVEAFGLMVMRLLDSAGDAVDRCCCMHSTTMWQLYISLDLILHANVICFPLYRQLKGETLVGRVVYMLRRGCSAAACRLRKVGHGARSV